MKLIPAVTIQPKLYITFAYFLPYCFVFVMKVKV